MGSSFILRQPVGRELLNRTSVMGGGGGPSKNNSLFFPGYPPDNSLIRSLIIPCSDFAQKICAMGGEWLWPRVSEEESVIRTVQTREIPCIIPC